MWHKNTSIPPQGWIIRYKDNNGIIHRGMFDAYCDNWRVCDLLGGIVTLWRDVVEWNGADPLLVDVRYQDFLLASIEAELA